MLDDLDIDRALTVTQPWGGLLVTPLATRSRSAIKPIENRTRKMAPPDLFGKRFAIHASREIDEDVYTRIMDLDDGIHSATFLDHSDGMIVQKIATDAPWYKLSRITSAIIGVVTLKHQLCGWSESSIRDHADSLRQQLEIFLGPGNHLRWFFGSVGYILTDPIILPTPVPARGYQGFWSLTDDQRRDVRAQLEIARAA